MKKKNYRFLSLLLALPLLLGGCGSTEQSGQGGGGGGSSAQTGVTGVTISGATEKTVLDGTRASLKATVAGEGVSQKVTWTSSDNTVATVTNGVVNFLKVSEQKKVTITAAANDDKSVTDSVEFTVEHSPFDLKNSRGNPDTSMYFDDGSFIVEDPQDIALVYADVHDTRWYVEATIIVDSFDPDDAYPKFGIMASERDDGMWCHEKSHQVFYYVDTVAAASTWTAMNAVMENSELTDWFWGGQIGSATASPAVKKGEAFKMGLMRDGDTFYQFYGKATDLTLKVVGSFEYKSFGEEANYVWVGGWKTAATISGAKWLVGDQIDTLYTIPQSISLKSEEETLFLGESYQIVVEAEGLWNKHKLTFASADESIATVDAKGVVTASTDNIGTTTITVGMQGVPELSAEFTVHATLDPLYNVVLDGEMNDAIWSEKVKTNSYILKKNNENYVRIYGAKNPKGLYLFMDYVVGATAVCNANEWWTWENVEFRLANDGKAWSGQYWLSSMNGGSFVSVGSDAAGYHEKAEDIFYKTIELGDDDLYHAAFEMFVPYGDDCVTKGQATYACFGFAPRAGWQAGHNWYGAITENTLNITADGFAHDGTQCSEENGHAGSWVVDVAATCHDEGSAHRNCMICGHYETKVLPVDPNNHVFDYSNYTAMANPTCITNATSACTHCGATEEIFVPGLPLNHENHAGTYTDGMYTCCHVNVEDGHTLTLDNLANDGGWAAHETNVATNVGGTSWTYVYEFDMTTNGISGNWWRGVLPFFKAEDGDIAVARFDWWGWVDDRSGGGTSIAGSAGDRANNPAMTVTLDWWNQREGGVSGDFETVMTNCHVKAVIVRDGSNLNSTFYLTSPSIDFTYQYHYNLTGVTTPAISLGITAEFGKGVVTSVYRQA